MAENNNNTKILNAADWYFSPPLSVWNNRQWPWINLNTDQYRYLYDRGRFAETAAVYWYVGLSVYPSLFFCILGSIFTVCTIILSAKKREKLPSLSSFHLIMISIACLDVIFMLMSCIRYGLYFWPVKGLSARYVSVILTGPSYACSLISDIITLCLSLERCIAIKLPIFYKNFVSSKRRVNCAWIVAVIISICISLTRLHYSIEKYNPDLYNIDWFVRISYFSDVIVPITMIVLMIPIVAVIIHGVGNRRNAVRHLTNKQQPQQNSTANNGKGQQQQQDQSMKMITLLISLLLMYFLNQLGYTLFGAANINYQSKLISLDYSNSYDEVKLFTDAHLFIYIVQVYSAVAEFGSRSLVFYCYIAFNRTFRNDFFGLFKNQLPTSGSMVNINNNSLRMNVRHT